MKKGFLIFFIFLTTLIFSSDFLDIYYNGTLVGKLPVQEFQEIVKSAKIYSELVNAETNDRIFIEVKDNPYVLKHKDTYYSQVDIVWKDKKDIIIKKISLESKVLLKRENFSELRIIYRDIAEVGFPSSLLLLFVLILAL